MKKRFVKVGGVRYEILRRMWRICNNPRSNDWNDEPEHLAVPYEILEEKKYSLSKKFSDEQLEELWGILGDIPVNDNDEIMERFMDFPAGTHKEDVWHWFDEKHSKGVYVLMHLGEGDGE